MGGLRNKWSGRLPFGEALDLPKKWRRIYFVASSSYPSAGCSLAEPASVSLDAITLPTTPVVVKSDFVCDPAKGSLALGLALLARRLELAIALGVDFQVPALQPILGRDVTQSTVQAHRVVMLDKLRHDPSRVLQAQRRFRPDGLLLERAMVAFQFAVGLGIMRAGQHVARLPQPQEFLEVLGHELRAVVADDPGPHRRMFLSGPLQDHLGIGFLHRFTDFPMHDETRTAIQNAAQIIEGSAH